jgi:hypothetical protein
LCNFCKKSEIRKFLDDLFLTANILLAVDELMRVISPQLKTIGALTPTWQTTLGGTWQLIKDSLRWLCVSKESF